MQIDKLSIRQRKILSFIHLNAAASYQEIAKACDTKDHIARSEVSSLLKAKIITSCMAVNYSGIGFQNHNVYFTVSALSTKLRQEFINYIKNHPRISWFCDFSGSYDFGITLAAHDPGDFDDQFRGIMSAYPGVIKSRQVALELSWNYFGKKYLFNDTERLKPIKVLFNSKKLLIDETDRGILKILSDDAFVSQQDISKKISMPISTVNNRLKSMQTRGIIAGRLYWISYSKLKIQAFRVFFNFGGLSDLSRKKLLNFAQSHPNIVSLIFTHGSWDMELGIEMEDKYHIHSVISEVQEFIDTPVFNTISLLRHDDIKWNMICPGMFE